MMPKILGWKVSSVLVAIQRGIRTGNTRLCLRKDSFFIQFRRHPGKERLNVSEIALRLRVRYLNDSSGDGLTSCTSPGKAVPARLLPLTIPSARGGGLAGGFASPTLES